MQSPRRLTRLHVRLTPHQPPPVQVQLGDRVEHWNMEQREVHLRLRSMHAYET